MAGNLSRNNDLGIGQSKWLKFITWFGIAFLLLPLIILIVYSFNESRTVTRWEGFSFRWYKALFSDVSIWLAIKNSLTIAIVSTLVSVSLGTMAAMLIARYSFKGKKLLQNILYIPVILPDIIFGVALLSLFILIKFPLGIISVICAHVTFSFPFATMVIMGKVINLPESLSEASLDLGASRWQTFVKVILPNIAPGVISGALFAFSMSIDDFVITFFTAGVGASTLPLKIYSLIKHGITPSLNAISTILIVFTVVVLLMANFLQKTKKISRSFKIALGTFFLIIVGLLVVSPFFTKSSERLNIYNYSNYLDPELIKKFSNETGIKVTLDYVNDNDEMLAKLQMGVAGYDIIFPTAFMVEIMKKQNLLAPICIDSIPNYKYITPGFRKMSFDTTGRYYVPYAYGYTGMVYNSNYIEGPVDSWDILWDERYKGKIMMINEMREVFFVASKRLGFKMDTSLSKLNMARDILIEQKPLLKKYESNAIGDLMASEEVWIAQDWSGSITRLTSSDPKFKLGYPKEGVLFFIDNMCIPANAPNKGNAERFINFLLDPAHSAQNINCIMYAMPNDSAKKLIPAEILNNPTVFPKIKNFDSIEIARDFGEFNRELTRAWMEVKVH
ncbi:MAG: extracellular solute-binding protein [Prolixibacteraceae bacterium]|nr:extracellular solute-binding protein [Prolixibacteraceae bacterium]